MLKVIRLSSASLPRGRPRAVAREHGQADGTPTKAHGLAGVRNPDVNLTPAHRAARVGDDVLAAVLAGFEPHARPDGQNPPVCGDDAAGRRPAARGAPAKAVGRGRTGGPASRPPTLLSIRRRRSRPVPRRPRPSPSGSLWRCRRRSWPPRLRRSLTGLRREFSVSGLRLSVEVPARLLRGFLRLKVARKRATKRREARLPPHLPPEGVYSFGSPPDSLGSLGGARVG